MNGHVKSTDTVGFPSQGCRMVGGMVAHSNTLEHEILSQPAIGSCLTSVTFGLACEEECKLEMDQTFSLFYMQHRGF